jgi:RNA polymerase sigma factor (sigma-70 family)
MAFSELHRRHYPSLRAFVFHLLGSRHRHEDAEDVVQDAFARAFDALSEQTFSGDFRRWIFTIARNRSIDLLRGERVRLISLDADGSGTAGQAAAESTTPVAVAESRDEVAWLVSAMEKLPERQRSALLLRELAGLSHAEIAETLDTTTGSARQLITRARDGIRDAAERDGRDHDTGKRGGLQRDLLEAAPVLPLAAAGMVATTGATAGGGIAIGKLVATVLAAMVLAGSAGEVGREIARADGSPSARQSVPPEGVVEVDRVPPRAEQRSDSSSRPGSKIEREDAPTPEKRSDAVPNASTPDPAPATPAAQEKNPSADATDGVVPEVAQPVEEVVELPGKVVEHVVGGLDGSTPLDQTVGNVVGEVTETIGEVTSGLLGPTSR